MLSRRRFAGMATGMVCAQAFGLKLGSAADTAARVSVMMWTLKDRGTFRENLELVARAGYRRIELVEEWKAWSAEEQGQLLGRMRELGICIDAMAGVTAGFADPAAGDRYVTELRTLMPVAKRLGCGQVILLSGKVLAGAAEGVQYRAAVETLRRSAEVLAAAGVVGVIEPIDRLEQPEIYLDGVTEGFRMVEEVGSPAVKVLYDLYHEQRVHGNLAEKLEKHIGSVGLVHVAEVPGRHRPGTGEIDYGYLYAVLKRVGYRGVVAMEFYPVGDPVEELRRARVACEAALGGS